MVGGGGMPGGSCWEDEENRDVCFSINERFPTELPSGDTRGPRECMLETEAPALGEDGCYIEVLGLQVH